MEDEECVWNMFMSISQQKKAQLVKQREAFNLCFLNVFLCRITVKGSVHPNQVFQMNFFSSHKRNFIHFHWFVEADWETWENEGRVGDMWQYLFIFMFMPQYRKLLL